MKNVYGEVILNQKIAENTFRMKLKGDFGIEKPGQFVNISIDGCYLRRPISVSEYEQDEITIIYKTVGDGTYRLSRKKAGDVLDILSPLGNGFTIDDDLSVLILGGGVGVAPMIGLSRELMDRGRDVTCVFGFNTEAEVFGVEELKASGVKTILCTADGSLGVKGFVTDALDGLFFTRFYACGPEPMLKAVDNYINDSIGGSLSFEARMGCGFGACMGCSCETKYGNLRICTDGPVLDREVVKW